MDCAELISSEEGISVDFKKSDILSDSFKVAKTLTAFANTVGGFLLIGVCNDKSLEGLKYDDNYIRNIVSIARDKCEPSLAPVINIHKDNEKHVYIVEVKRFEIIPYAVKSKDGNVYFIRVGESVRQTTPLELQKLFEAKNSISKKCPLLNPYFINSEGELVGTLEISPEFPIIEEKVTFIPKEVWQMKKIAESVVSTMLQHVEEQSKTSIKLDSVSLAIVNEGDAPAENIRITVIFPKEFILFEESDLRPSSLITPLLFKKSYGGLYKNDIDKYICRGWINELGNDLQVELEPIYPEVLDEEKVYDITIKITQNNYPISETVLKLSVKPKHPKLLREVEKPEPITNSNSSLLSSNSSKASNSRQKMEELK